MTSDLTKHIAGQLRRRMADLEADKKTSRRAVSTAAGLSQTTGNKIFVGKRAPNTDELEALCEQLGLDFGVVVSEAAAAVHKTDPSG